MSRLKNIFFVFLLYLYAFYIIYIPNLFANFGIEYVHILYIIFGLQLAYFIYKKNSIKELIGKNGMRFCIAILFLSLYFVIVAIANGTSLTDLVGLRIIQNNLPIVCYFNISFLLRYLKKMNYTNHGIIDFFFRVMSIQGIICILMLIFPPIRSIALNLYPLSDNPAITNFRIYGITFDYTFGMQILHGVFSTIVCVFAILKNKKYFKYLPFVLIPSILNGRTGLLVFLLTFVIFIVVYCIKNKKLKNMFKYALFLLVFLILGAFVLKKYFPYTYNSFNDFIMDTIDLLTGKGTSGNYSVLINDMLFFPKGIHLIFGHGIKVFDNVQPFGNSDIGYVNDVFLGGIVYAILLYLIYISLFSKILNKKNSSLLHKMLFLIIIVSLFMINIKGEAFRSMTILNGIFFIVQFIDLIEYESDLVYKRKNHKKILVSVCCLAYNHEEYIGQAIESFLNQNTNFRYEIVIHDDCSTDSTLKIIKEYQRKYPKIIKVITEEKNVYSQGIKIEPILYSHCKGKYIALCEGDDFWCDEDKLQKQFNFMEMHPECSLVTHGSYILNDYNGKMKPKLQPYSGSRYYTIDEIITGDGGIFSTNSMFYRAKFVEKMPDFYYKISIGDLPTMMHLALNGRVYYIDELMSVYRMNAKSSWTVNQTLGTKNELIKKQKRFYDEISIMLHEFNKQTNFQYNVSVEKLLLIKRYIYFIIIGNFDEIKKDEYKELYKIFTHRELLKKIKLFIIRNIPMVYMRAKGK